MAENIEQKINEWAEKFKSQESEKTSRAIFEEMCGFSDENEANWVGKIVLFINQCIVLDALSIDTYKIGDKTYSRDDIVEKIKSAYKEFIQSSNSDEWENDSTLAFKEHISYLIALILYKVHNYKEAYQYFTESRKFSARLDNAENVNGLDLLGRIERDIHFAYCCEYIGTPTMHYEKLVESLEILLGTKERLKDTDKYWKEYWQKFKDYSYDRIDELERIFSSGEDCVEKTKAIINILLGFSGDSRSVFTRLIKMQNKEEKKKANIYNEAVHALAHCLNELNMGLPAGGHDDKEVMENHNKRTLMKTIACICIDSLGEHYVTCQATIRAEQDNGFDAIAIMHEKDEKKFEEQDLAELDFYQYYFESLFLDQDLKKEHEHGEKFREFCTKKNKSNQDNYQDGLLHYYVVSLRKQLKLFLEEFSNSSDRNDLFFRDDKKIHVSKSGCFEYYKELQKKEFSKFVNIQMVNEREKLLIVYEILQNLQNSKLPLFYERENFNNDLTIDRNIEELFDLCKRFNRFFKVNMKLLEEMDSGGFLNEQTSAYSNCDSGKLSGCKQKEDSIILDGVPALVEGLVFELYGNINNFKSYFERNSFTDYKIWERVSLDRDKLNFGNKILYVDDAENCADYCLKLCENMDDKNVSVFYVGEPDKDLKNKRVAAFESINMCFLMAYIYGSIERIYDYLFNPKPIYILVPLRNVSNYEFQEARFKALLKYPVDYKEFIMAKRGGIGICCEKEDVKEDYFRIDFKNLNIQKACIGLIKLHEDKLYVLRGDKLVRRKTAHIGFVKKTYADYAGARKKKERKRHSFFQAEYHKCQVCDYFYKCISDEEFTVEEDDAAKKLCHLWYIACEEQRALTDECYLLQKAKNQFSVDKGFELCIFNRDITNFLEEKCCLKEVVTVTKAEPAAENTEKKEQPAEKESESWDKHKTKYSNPYVDNYEFLL